VTHAATIESGLAARLGVDVADFVEECEGIVVSQRMVRSPLGTSAVTTW